MLLGWNELKKQNENTSELSMTIYYGRNDCLRNL